MREPHNFQAFLFDMDGLLAETESLWRIAETRVAGTLGIELSEGDLRATMGLRIDEVVARWQRASPWGSAPSRADVATQIVDEVIALCDDLVPLPGALAALDLADAEGARVALCSSSSPRLIAAITERLGIADRFEVLHSAQGDPHGKPHPEPYLRTAAELGVAPDDCLVFEDSLAGCVAAVAAGMTTVAVPDPSERGSARFGFVAATLDSLIELTPELIAQLRAKRPLPTLSRPRFHLAFPVHDLELARGFYLDVLGCREGRSSAAWVDFDLYGHQIVAHLAPRTDADITNAVDGEVVPVRHFGVLLTVAAWNTLVARLRQGGEAFLVEPQIRFEGKSGEQRTFFVRDPSGNALEFKAFADDRMVFSGGPT